MSFIKDYVVGGGGNASAMYSPMGAGDTTGIINSGSGSGFGNFGNALGMTSQGISAVGELYNIWQSRKNYKLAKDAFKFNKQLSTINLNNQAKLTNERLETRQNTRRADNPNAEDTSSFMAKYKVSGIGG
jgi:hypothetical protein